MTGDGGDLITPSDINSQIENRGWGVSVIDRSNFYLIIALLEMEGDFGIKSLVQKVA